MGRSHFRYPLVFSLCLIACAGCDRASHGTLRSTSPLASIPGRPLPQEETFRGCPPAGRGNEDPFINLLKNRIDKPFNPGTFTLSELESLDWPSGVTDVPTAKWPSAARALIFKHDGLPAQFVGYIAAADVGGPEPANCSQPAALDWHVYMVAHPHAAHRTGFIAEITPRIRARAHNFRLATLQSLARRGVRVRLRGWLMFDSEHPEQPTQRATIWEIHPVTSVETWNGRRWVAVAGTLK